MKAFGPVPSRRLGQSLGIKHVPLKYCTYECIYCQIGHTPDRRSEREEFYSPEVIILNVEQKIKDAKILGEQIDYITFVPDGEPTLDKNLGKIIDLIKPLGIKIAVITNSSLINDNEIQYDLNKADLVSFKIDAVSKYIWKAINRPQCNLDLKDILDGITDFSLNYKGKLIIETMLIDGINDKIEEIEKIADFVSKLNPDKSYISIPVKPPAIKWVRPASEHIINKAYHIFRKKGIKAEYLTGSEGSSIVFKRRC